MEAEKADVSFSVCSESIQSSVSLSSVPSPSSQSGRTEDGTSEAATSVSRSPGKSAEEVEALGVRLEVIGDGMADVGASEVGKDTVGGQVELIISGRGVNAATTGCKVLKAAVVGGSVNHTSGTVAGSEVGRAV